MTPSLPTFSIAFAINSPISLSPLADIVPTYHHIYKLQCFVNTLTVQNPSCCFQSPTMQVVAPIKKKDTQTWAISSEVLIIRALLFRFVTTASNFINSLTNNTPTQETRLSHSIVKYLKKKMCQLTTYMIISRFPLHILKTPNR